MKCITSPALDDTKIVSYVEGEADDAVVAHIRACPFCSERVNRWTLLQNSLRKQLYRVTCPTPMELGDYHLGLLPPPQVLVIAQHVRECPFCRREVAELEDFMGEQAPEVSLLGAARVLIARLVRGPLTSGQPGESGFQRPHYPGG
jgi:anti-sigma factor RsiW